MASIKQFITFDRALSRLVYIIPIGYPLCRKKPPSLIACLLNFFIILSNSTVSAEWAVHYCLFAVFRVEAFIMKVGMFVWGL